MQRFSSTLAVGTLLLLLSGCAHGPGPFLSEDRLQPAAASPPAEWVEPVLYAITPGLIAAQQREVAEARRRFGGETTARTAYEYRVGAGDVLTVIVWDHPELTLPAGGYRSAEEAGIVIDSNGEIFYPYVGALQVAGKTTVEIRAALAGRLAKYLNRPQVDVRVATFRNKSVLVNGAVKQPSRLPITDRPLSVLEAVNLSGGATAEADLGDVTLTRDGRAIHLDLLYLYRGQQPADLLLQDGDQVYVPGREERLVYILGEVSKPTAQPMRNGRMSLAEAIGATGGMASGSADPSRVFVIRGDLKQPVVYQLDAREPDALLVATLFELKPRDVVYVAVNDLARWNRVASQIVPTIQALWQTGALLKW